MNNLKSVEYLYKPYRITLKGNVNIIESIQGKYVLKKENKDLFVLYSYLANRGINNYPKLIRNFNEEENLLEYVEPVNIPIEQFICEMASALGNIHLKTVYDKQVSIDELKEIKENVENNISYLNNHYHKIIKNILLHNLMSPKEYFFIKNYYKVQESLDFCQSEINNWFILVKDKESIRVCLLHNNLSLDHFVVSSDKNTFISWDNYRFDIPLLDIVSFFKNNNIEKYYKLFLDNYFSVFKYNEEEIKLLLILLSIPDNFDIEDSIEVLINKYNKLLSIEKLIGPYNSKNKEE